MLTNILTAGNVLFVKGIGFDPFFRGFLSVLVAFVVLIGGTYLLVATNTGARQGMLISVAGLFGWMFLMGIIWSIYGIGWIGEAPKWELAEINIDKPEDVDDGLQVSELEQVQQLAGKNIEVDDSITDPDEAQAAAVTFAKSENLGDWKYLDTGNATRGEAQAAAETFLVEEEVFQSGEYIPLRFGGFSTGGKPKLTEDPSTLDRVWHTIDETVVHPIHSPEYMVIQVKPVVPEASLPGQAPPVPKPDEDGKLVSVVMKLDRGGPFPAFVSGLRFTPMLFTFATGILFGVSAWSLHIRDKNETKVRAKTK